MSLENLIQTFLDKTGYLQDNKILAIVVYGSRVRKTNKESSDLDILVISDDTKNYKASMMIEGIRVDYNIYSVRDIFDIAYSNKVANNAYFESVLKTGMVIKNQNYVIEQLESYLEELRNLKTGKKKLSLKVIGKIKEAYEDFISKRDLPSYFYLLECLRTSYNYIKNCSYVSMIKVYDVFRNRDFYEETYSIKIPGETFTSLFLMGIETSDYDIQLEIVGRLLLMLGIDLNQDVYYEKNDCLRNSDAIKRELIVLHNKVLQVILFLKGNHPYGPYCYFVTLQQMNEVYFSIYGEDSPDILETIKISMDKSNEEKASLIKRLFSLLDKDYHLDYDNFMLKLKL